MVDEGAVVAQARHLALAAQLARRGQPAVKQAGRRDDQRGRGKENVASALGVIVAVHLALVCVLYLHDAVRVLRSAGKLDEPLVMAASSADGIDGSGSVVEHLGSGLLGGKGDGVVGIVDHQFLAKGVDEALLFVYLIHSLSNHPAFLIVLFEFC